ncbi:MAG: amino acid adenylation domain-containing protein [Myxacorys californica WJT36-NPBG1]|jgi:amino acid adenylation domain-containing protein|nr:amino acid adenylation domain-containing protein [Myxacorys californica WJT36-NPBG1]
MKDLQTGISEGFQLSPQQKWVWRSQQLDPTFPYRVQGSILIEGHLNLDLFKQAFQCVVDRHEILRTRFVCLMGMTIPLQIIQNANQFSIVEHDLSHLSPSEQLIQIESKWHEIGQQSFDFEQGLIGFSSLITLSSARHILLINLSALNADSSTLVNLLQGVCDTYSECLEDKSTRDPLQYADIAQWQTELLESDESQAGKVFWQKLKFNTSDIPKLPLEQKEASQHSFNPQCLSLEISKPLEQKIIALSQSENVPVSTILLACWKTLIWRFNHQSHLVIGIAVNGRNYEELITAFGLLSKTIPLATNFATELEFSQVLQQVHQSVQDAKQWQEYFEWKDVIQTEDAQEIEFLPISFDFQELPKKRCQNNLAFSIQKLCSYIDRFNLKLFCTQQNDSLNVEFHYDANAFNETDIQRLSEHFASLLESAVTHPKNSIAQLNLLNDRHRHQLLVEFNQTQANFVPYQCVHQRFEAQAEQTPDQIAIVFEDQRLTYRELNCRANQLAHYLQKLGVNSEVVVGICCDRSLDSIVALLGILKAGGAYLPLDPAMPTERRTRVLQDAKATVLLTQQSLVNQFGNFTQPIVCLDRDFDLITQESSQNCISQTTSENLAYVIYTSGSTGAPKGVAIEHRQLLNYLDGILHQLALPKGAHFAMVSTFAADLGNTAIFPALCTGGCLHIISQQRSIDPEVLAQYCCNHSIDCLKIVPSHLSALLSCTYPEAILPRQRLILGGEALSWDLVKTVQELAPDCRIFNHYGPTEATIGVLTYEVKLDQPTHISKTVPLGRPLANTQIYILDAELQPVPVGAVGELYIGGNSLARGYLNQPKLTAEKFIPHPFMSGTEARLYRTGDLARYLPDGNIEFLGRIDHQVKIRGFRIELGEIEAVLKQHSIVKEAVVAVKEDTSGELRLVAYVLPHEQEMLDKCELHRWLSEKLPEYMMPSAFVMLKTLPLTANGKLDRQALPVPDFTHTTLENFVAPRNPIEQTLADIWAEVLKLDQVGIYDNFFELGGHSLLATQVVSRLRQTFQVELPLHHLFEATTIADLAVVIVQKLTEQTDETMLAQMLAELEELSEEDAQTVLVQGVQS